MENALCLHVLSVNNSSANIWGSLQSAAENIVERPVYQNERAKIYSLYLLAFGTGNKHGHNPVQNFTEKMPTFLYFIPVHLPFFHGEHISCWSMLMM
jgi:hypothetical protein